MGGGDGSGPWLGVHLIFWRDALGSTSMETERLGLWNPLQEAARRVFAAMLEREGSFPESSDSSSEEEADVARGSLGPACVEQIHLPDRSR